MTEIDTETRLIKATIELLKAAEEPEKVTARQIAIGAKANLAMINYFFKSKDELVNIAIQLIINEKRQPFTAVIDTDAEPKERLYQVLNYFCELSISFQQYLGLTVPFKLLIKELAVPVEILAIIEEFYQSRIPTQYCRMIALQMTTFTELFFLRAVDFKAYSGINIYDIRQREQYLRFQIELFLQDKNQ